MIFLPLMERFKLYAILLRKKNGACYTPCMWPFSRRTAHETRRKGVGMLIHTRPLRETKRTMKRMVAGFIIGGAIGSIIGKRLLEQRKVDFDTMEKNEDTEPS